MEGHGFFHYKSGKTFLHQMTPWLKLIMMLTLAIAAFYCPTIPCIMVFSLLIAFSVFFLKFSVLDIVSDLKPAFVYFLLLYLASTLTKLVSIGDLSKFRPEILMPDESNVQTIFRFLLSLEFTSIFFRTTTSVQLNMGFRQIESAVTRGKSTAISDLLSLTLNFIPRLSDFWQRLDRAWKARGGKNGLKKIRTLTPLLFKTGMQEAYGKSLAIRNRT
ncbi:MAG: energy-coupling factor transporter transmembrane protein EcfT [Treponema sp.]|nr:energy-coupling factor transporter transmembrane protein EcfT [Treponema sp.]